MDFMFAACKRLQNLDLGSFNTSSVIRMRGMFADCRQLTDLNLSSFDTSQVIDMDGIFKGCLELASLDLRSFDTSKVDEMAEIFANCPSLKQIAFGFGSRNILKSLTGYWYFNNDGPYSLNEILEKSTEENTGGVIIKANDGRD